MFDNSKISEDTCNVKFVIVLKIIVAISNNLSVSFKEM